MAESLTTINRFFDSKNYPRGFSRHGDFTIEEAQLLERHDYIFNELELGECEPVTGDEKQFISVCHGEHEPVTEAERVWIKCVARIKRSKRFRTLSDGESQMEGADDHTEGDD